jgi:cysteine-rich repeat protein
MVMMGLRRVAVVCVLLFAACKVPNANKIGGDAAPACGDGKLDPGEACDDGNTISGDGCNADCTSDETCGNGIKDPGEQCDDGNTVACDGCSADCKSDETCGNNIVDACKGETCDDGNNRSGDGCSSTCQSNEQCGNGMVDANLGEQCDTGGIETATCEVDCKLARCGDGIKNTLAGESCDDGNTTSGDGCDDKCHKEICGDSIVEDDEQCDDGTNATNGACPACHNAVCGDFYVRTTPPQLKEQCDEGPTPDPHGACPSMCKSAHCGDRFVWNTEGGTEQCDDGINGTNGPCPSCKTAFCGDFHVWNIAGGNEQCDEGPTPSIHGACPKMCQAATCGDGYVWNIEGGSEDCDTNGTDTSSCNGGDCHTPMCGDSYTNHAAGEDCDEGATPDPMGACPVNCTDAYCGDGYVWSNEGGTEQCDHAGMNGNDGICDATCQCVNGPPCQ